MSAESGDEIPRFGKIAPLDIVHEITKSICNDAGQETTEGTKEKVKRSEQFWSSTFTLDRKFWISSIYTCMSVVFSIIIFTRIYVITLTSSKVGVWRPGVSFGLNHIEPTAQNISLFVIYSLILTALPFAKWQRDSHIESTLTISVLLIVTQ
jgi:hypothetical protein